VLSLSQTWNFVEKSVARILKNAAACCGLTRFVGGLFLITAMQLRLFLERMPRVTALCKKSG
jgi:hypothetical protein